MRRPFPSHSSAITHGFTLMELLVVISIIMILMGMLFAGIRLAKEAAARAKTQATMSQLVAACESYRQTNGRYPENTDTNPPTITIGFNDNLAFGAAASYTQPYSNWAANWGNINIALICALNLAGESFKAPVNDAWKMPIHYRPARYYPYITGSTTPIDSDEPPGRDSFQMWSMGKNKTDEGGLVTSDDITSWTK